MPSSDPYRTLLSFNASNPHLGISLIMLEHRSQDPGSYDDAAFSGRRAALSQTVPTAHLPRPLPHTEPHCRHLNSGGSW